MFTRFLRLIDITIYIMLGVLLLAASDPLATDPVEQARAFTRPVEFDYVSWSVNAALLKLESGATGVPAYFDNASRKQVVMTYLRVTGSIIQGEDQLNKIYADPNITDKEAESAHLHNELDNLYKQQKQLAPLAEGTLQAQVSSVLADLGLTDGGQPIPPVLFHSSPVPMGLVISPRDHIEQLTNISVQPNLPVDEQASIEDRVDKALNVSSLVVPIGGVGVYPTMVMRTTSLDWLLNTISHEWTHNYLTLRPLGVLYDKTPELRTMNETTASIVGNEVGVLVLKRYYPELSTASSIELQTASGESGSTSPNAGSDISFVPQGSANPLATINPDGNQPPFDFRAEMHETRVTVDKLLAEGKIDEAESYMEARRQVFWDNGYAIRKLNQAYFAFYGAYADVPGGAAGEDPVGPAVRALREQSASLKDFVNRISWMTSFAQLQEAVK